MTVSLEDVLRSNYLTFPVDVAIVKGLQSISHLSLSSDSRIRILLAANETVFRCQTEPDHRSFSISLNCPDTLELLQPDAALDDQTYETAGDILQASVRPCWVYVQIGYAGRTTSDTIEVDDILEDLRLGTNEQGEDRLCATRVLQTDQRKPVKEAVVLSLDTVGEFTTAEKFKDRSRCLAIDLVEKWARVPQRVRIHGNTGKVFNARILKLEEQKVAVCIHLGSGQYMAIPASSEIHVRVVKEYPISSRLSRSLHKWINIATLPRIESFCLEGQSHFSGTLPSVDHIAVLFLPTRYYCSLNTDYLCHYETLVQHPGVFAMCSGPIHQTGSLPESNLLSQHRNLCNELSQGRLLLEDSTKIEGEDDVNDDDYEYLGYEKVNSTQPSHYASLQTASSESVTVLSEQHYTELKTHHVHVGILTKSKNPTYSEIGEPSQLLNVHAKLDRVKRDNVALQQHIASLVDELNYLQPLDTESVEKLILSLSCTETVHLLENVGLGMYKQKFIDEQVEGYLLTDCDRDYLIDLGMRPAHVCKFLAILKGRISRCTSWK